jgi:hypothetical protein
MSTTQSFPSAAKQTEMVESIATLYTKGVERLAEAQKKILDVAQQHNIEVIDAWKKIGYGTPGAPGHFILDLAATTFGQYADLQKGAIDLAVEQSQTLAGIAKERANSVSQATDGVNALARETLERTAALQRTPRRRLTPSSSSRALRELQSKQPLLRFSAEWSPLPKTRRSC